MGDLKGVEYFHFLMVDRLSLYDAIFYGVPTEELKLRYHTVPATWDNDRQTAGRLVFGLRRHGHDVQYVMGVANWLVPQLVRSTLIRLILAIIRNNHGWPAAVALLDVCLRCHYLLEQQERSWALELEMLCGRNHWNPTICKRLLDAGATLECLFRINDDANQAAARLWYHTRLAARAACVAVLSLRGRTPQIRRCLPLDVLRIVAAHVWRARFDVRPGGGGGARPKRAKKSK